MRIHELKPGTYFKSNGNAFLYGSQHIIRCWDGCPADAGFRAYPDINVEIINAEQASVLVREVLEDARLE